MSFPKKVAVVGANGFIGSRVMELFHLGGHCEVIPVVRGVSSLARLCRFDLDWRLADARDAEALAKALTGCDALVHCAVGDTHVIESAAAALVPAAVRAGIRRVVYLSTASVHGQNPAAGVSEDSPLSDRQEIGYNNAKVRAERTLFRDLQGGPLELIALRPSIVIGPRDAWISGLAKELENRTAWLINHGAGVCNTIYVDNLVHAIRLSLAAPPPATGQVYLVGDAEAVTWAHIYRRTCDSLGFKWESIHQIPIPVFPGPTWRNRLDGARVSRAGQKVIAMFPWRLKQVAKRILWRAEPDHARSPWELPPVPQPSPDRAMTLLQQCGYRLPQDKARRMLGYEPPVPFEEGLDRTLAWVKWTRS